MLSSEAKTMPLAVLSRTCLQTKKIYFILDAKYKLSFGLITALKDLSANGLYLSLYSLVII